MGKVTSYTDYKTVRELGKLNEAASMSIMDKLAKEADLNNSAQEYKNMVSNPSKYFKNDSNDYIRELMGEINEDLKKMKDVEGEEGYSELMSLIKLAKKKVGEEGQKRMNNILNFLRGEVAAASR